ncbi:hypothetical protein [Metasolibacillus sp.]|uniref:hypothetical protein n=1 Tax=Metasolibacillus sp. TaxID=2703680 RepID=UPI0025E11C51|nr:hypothetical protein [Metasolibacillus sp.]MCT6925577.1 hypothetical protein [Metasolibacillus sp.]MCT6941829.1 hypothetical protein [Metasolibacillus sp.]
MYGNYQPHPSHMYPQGTQPNTCNNGGPNNLQQQTLAAIAPVVHHGLCEAQYLGYQHALTEAVAIGYLIGKGYSFEATWKLVESWWRAPGSPLPQPY